MIGSQSFGPRGGGAVKGVLLAVAVLVAAALYFLQSNSGSREPVSADPAARDVGPQSPTELEIASPLPTATATRSTAMPIEVPAEPVAAIEESDSDEGDGAWVEVLCVHEESGAPAVGIDVYAVALDASLMLRLEASMASGTDPEEVLRGVVEPVATDESGSARVWTLSDREMVLVALGSDRMGYAQPGMRRERVTIEVAANHRMRVRVVDGDGVGVAGAVVSARSVIGEHRMDLITVLTDGEGHGVLKVPGQMARQHAAGSLFVGVKGLFPKPVEKPLDLGAGETKLELPPFGWALLSTGPTEEARPDLRLTLHATEPEPDPTPWKEHLEGLTGPDGSLRLGPIALGAELRAAGSALGSPVVWHAKSRGPMAHGETVRLELQRAAAFPLRGRALNPADEPFARALLQARLLEPDADASEDRAVERVRTDRDGYFTWELPMATTPGSEVWLSVSRRGVDYVASFAAPAANAEGIDLGDLHFREVPPIAMGRVLDPDGRPIAGAGIQLLQQTWSDDGNRAETRIKAATRTDADGRFVLRAPAAGGDLELFVSAEGFVQLTRRLATESDLGDLRLERAGGLRGQVLLGDRVEPNSFFVRTTLASGAGRLTALRENGTFTVDGLGTGVYDVSIFGNALVGDDRRLWSGVSFRADEGILELGTVDLTAQLARSELVARSPAGAALHELHVSTKGVGDDGFRMRISNSRSDGVHVLWHPVELTSARATADGYRTAPFALVGAREELTLRPALAVVLRAQGSESLPDSVVLSVHLKGPDREQPGQVFGLPDGRASFHLDQPGTYEVRFVVTHTDRPFEWKRAAAPHSTFELLETTAVQEFSFDLPEEVHTEARRAAGGD